MILSVLCLLSGVLGVNAVKLHAKNTAYKQQEAELKTQIKSEQARAEEIKEYEQYVQTDDYMKEIAEDKLNLVADNFGNILKFIGFVIAQLMTGA